MELRRLRDNPSNYGNLPKWYAFLIHHIVTCSMEKN